MDGELSPGEDPADWARYVMSIGLGMAVRAASGSPRGELETVGRMALLALPVRAQAPEPAA